MDILIIALLSFIIVISITVLVFVIKNKQSSQNDSVIENISAEISNVTRKTDDFVKLTGDEFQRNRTEISERIKEMNKANSEEFYRNRAETAGQMKEMNRLITEMQAINAQQAEKTNQTLVACVRQLQESNEKKLDQMRETVDEKLTSTLSSRLDSSFKVVGDQLQKVYNSIGEMNKLANGVNDLQRVLTNVKARGTWGEIQLGNILEQTMSPDQYMQNYSPHGRETVEYAVKIPSKQSENEFVWLPIDSKFPVEDYIRICDAAEAVDKNAVEEAVKALERRIRDEAKKISEKYIDVPKTTDFAIMFLPTEGLYAEVLRRPGLCESVQNKNKIMICGPTTITAFLNTLQVGFRTIAIDKKTSEIREILSAVKAQYSTFENDLAKVKKKLSEAASSIESAQKRNNIIVKKLKNVEEMPSGSDNFLEISNDNINESLSESDE